MANWLSFSRMTRSWQRLLGRVSTVFGLLLVASLAHAGVACVSAGPEAPVLRAAGQDRCVSANAALETCIVSPQRIEVPVAAASPSPEAQPAAGGTHHAARMLRTAGERQSPSGLAPASSAPVYILFRRYLS